jgi:KDO2-lipid IV(A) lauroyltransferase
MRHRLEYLLVRSLVAVVRVAPDALVRAFGTSLGLTFYLVDRAHRRIAERNLATAFPTRPAAERTAIARAAFEHFGRLLVELLKFSTLSDEEMLARVDVDGEDRSRAAYAHGKGVLFVTGHFGFWELQALVHALRVEPIAVLARALDNPRLNELLERIRARTGNSVIYRRGTIRRVMRTLQAGRGVAILIDQHIMSRDAIYVDFFSRPAATTSAVAALALRTGAPFDLRASGRAAGRRCAGCDPRVHAAVHRRPRDVRAPQSGTVVVDAPPLARRSAGERDSPRNVPVGKQRHVKLGTLGYVRRAAIGIRQPVPNARSVTLSPGAACLRLNSAACTSRRTR